MLEAYDQKYIHTPNLDRLAKESFVFQRAYCQHAVCIPSRNSFMTGRRPDTTHVWIGFGNANFRVTGPDWISLPEHFKKNGYTTLGGGKTFHPNSPPNWDEPKSWSQDQPYFPFSLAKCPNTTTAHKLGAYVADIDTWCPLDEKEYPDSYHYDWQLANHTIHTLKYLKDKGGPCIRHAYYASVSWVDSQIGRVLQALDDMSLADDTLVVLFGDHGFQLGEHDSWAKMTNWELAVRVPLIIRAPWKPASAGKRSHAFVELVDLYRTISELVGAPSPGDDIEGVSFASLFDSPDLNAHEAALALNKTPAAYSQYTRCLKSIDAPKQWDNNSCSETSKNKFMGYSVRVPNWRYTAWMEWDDSRLKAKWESEPYAVELYDHHKSDGADGTENDFNQCEIENVADKNPEVVKELQNQLKSFFN
uniref:Sulfatase N-terminal domain-containing protein n=1 Tax=Amphimedon queenslandica TaxID=400682 RepID=A0A1X7TKQ4_AMPQE